MKKYILAICLTISQTAYSQAIIGTVPIICTTLEDISSTLEQFNEFPLLTAQSNRDFGDELLLSVPMVVFFNRETGSFTIAEQVNDMFCITAIGENMKPYIDQDEKESSKGKKS
jgi:hypothetical protein